MKRGAGIALITIGWLAYFAVTAILAIPFGMAEPGQPRGLGGLGLFWAMGEWTRTWWVLVRRPTVDIPRLQRGGAIGIVLLTSLVAAIAGLSLASDTYQPGHFERSEYVSFLLTTAGCWLGRWWLRRDT